MCFQTTKKSPNKLSLDVSPRGIFNINGDMEEKES